MPGVPAIRLTAEWVARAMAGVIRSGDPEREFGGVSIDTRTLKAGGVFVASVYHQDARRRIGGQPADGLHPNGIPFHFFSPGEFRQELRTFFGDVRARPIDITLPLEKRLHLPDRLEGLISRISERVPLLNQFGHLILAKARKGT